MKISGSTILNVWGKSLRQLVNAPSIVPTERNLDTYEIQNAVLVIEHPMNGLNELLSLEKDRGNDYSDVAHQQYWKVVADKLEKFPRTSVAQIDSIVTKLKNSPFNRHGYASIWTPSIDMVSDYPSCIIGVYFMVRNDQLNMTAILRSNDAWGQALNDMYELVQVQEKVARRLQLNVGTYSHFAMSYHLYTKDRMDALILLEEKHL